MSAPVIYFAARYSRAEEMQEYRKQLQEFGYEVTSRWIDHHGGRFPVSLLSEDIEGDLILAGNIALTDLEDLIKADILIAFTEKNPGGKGGRHFELGYAVRAGKRIIVVGPRENIFHALSFVQHHCNWTEFITHVRSINATSTAGSPT